MLDRNSSFEPGQRKHQVVQMLEIKQEDYIKNVILKKEVRSKHQIKKNLWFCLGHLRFLIA